MRNINKIFTILFVLFVSLCLSQKTASAQHENVNFQVFYDQLSPYGQWVENPDYGYIWYPDVDENFSPYATSGNWVMTDYGWTWVSDYSWGWAPFHYGRWDYDNSYGWFWVPDNQWGPSWVTWRRASGYYGWTPMRPGISVSLSFNGGYRDADHWNFVRDRDFGGSDMGQHYINRGEYSVFLRNSTVINNTYIDRSRNTTYIAGPPRDNVQKFTGRRVNNVTIRDNDRPGSSLKNNQLQIYRPQINRNNDKSQNRAAPSRITNARDVRPTNERGTPQRNGATPTGNNRKPDQQSQPQQRQAQPAQRNEQQKGQPQQRQQQSQPQQRQAQPAQRNEQQRQQQLNAQKQQQQNAQQQRQQQGQQQQQKALQQQQQRQLQQNAQQQRQQQGQQQQQRAQQQQQQQQRQQQQNAQQQKQQQGQQQQQRAQQQQQQQQQQQRAQQQKAAESQNNKKAERPAKANESGQPDEQRKR